MDKQLYTKLIKNISKGIEKALNEEIQNFDITDYTDAEQDIIDQQTMSNFTGFDYSKFNELVDKFNKLDISENSKEFLQPELSIILYDKKQRPYKKIINYNFFYDKDHEFDNIEFLNKIQKLNKNFNKVFTISVQFLQYFNDSSPSGYYINKQAEYSDFIYNFIYFHSNVHSLQGVYSATTGKNYRKGNIDDTYFEQTFYPKSDLSRYQWQISDIDEGAKNMYEFIDLYIKYIEDNIDEIQKIE